MYRHNTAHVMHNESEGQNSYTTINLLQFFFIFSSFFPSSNYFSIKWLANCRNIPVVVSVLACHELWTN